MIKYVCVLVAGLIMCVVVLLKFWMFIFGESTVQTVQCSETYSNRKFKRDHLKVLSLNIYMRIWSVGDNKNFRLDYFIDNYLNNYDIVCLQEMFGVFTFRQNYLVDRARKMGFKYCVTSQNPRVFSTKLIDSGLVILSRVPILECNFVPYTSGIYVDSYADKGFQYCIVRVKGEKVGLINTHLQSSYKLNDVDAEITRISQLVQLGNYLKGKGDMYLIICGDMSCDVGTEGYRKMCEILGSEDLLSSFSEGNRPPTTWSTYCKVTGNEIDTVKREKNDPELERNKWVNKSQSIDYVLSKNLECVGCTVERFKIGERFLSDHCGVVAEVKMK